MIVTYDMVNAKCGLATQSHRPIHFYHCFISCLPAMTPMRYDRRPQERAGCGACSLLSPVGAFSVYRSNEYPPSLFNSSLPYLLQYFLVYCALTIWFLKRISARHLLWKMTIFFSSPLFIFHVSPVQQYRFHQRLVQQNLHLVQQDLHPVPAARCLSCIARSSSCMAGSSSCTARSSSCQGCDFADFYQKSDFFTGCNIFSDCPTFIGFLIFEFFSSGKLCRCLLNNKVDSAEMQTGSLQSTPLVTIDLFCYILLDSPHA